MFWKIKKLSLRKVKNVKIKNEIFEWNKSIKQIKAIKIFLEKNEKQKKTPN